MGHGIAQVAAQAGLQVVLCETAQAFLDQGLARIEGSLGKMAQKAVEKGKASPEDARKGSDATRARIAGTLSTKDLADCDLVVEAIVEDLDAKKKLFAELGQACKLETILASNTSSFPILEMAEASGRPGRFVGLHFFNPVQLMKLVEVVRTKKTDENVFAAARSFGEAVGKVPVACKDTPGFVVTRLLVPYMTQALEMLGRVDATKEDIDAAMMYGPTGRTATSPRRSRRIRTTRSNPGSTTSARSTMSASVRTLPMARCSWSCVRTPAAAISPSSSATASRPTPRTCSGCPSTPPARSISNSTAFSRCSSPDSRAAPTRWPSSTTTARAPTSPS
jgi:hypothetical protein